MIEEVRNFIRNFAKPPFDIHSDIDLDKYEELHQDLEARRKEIEIRLRLANMRASPRGELNG